MSEPSTTSMSAIVEPLEAYLAAAPDGATADKRLVERAAEYQLEHRRTCTSWTPLELCDCALYERTRIAELQRWLKTEQEMHNAWRERAEEAEAAAQLSRAASPSPEQRVRDAQGVWACKIGMADALPMGADWPMRRAVEKAFQELTGKDPAFIFSGWNAQLTEGERAVVDSYERTALGSPRETPAPEHRCGVSGFSGLLGDVCAGCEYDAKQRATRGTPVSGKEKA